MTNFLKSANTIPKMESKQSGIKSKIVGKLTFRIEPKAEAELRHYLNTTRNALRIFVYPVSVFAFRDSHRAVNELELQVRRVDLTLEPFFPKLGNEVGLFRKSATRAKVNTKRLDTRMADAGIKLGRHHRDRLQKAFSLNEPWELSPRQRVCGSHLAALLHASGRRFCIRVYSHGLAFSHICVSIGHTTLRGG